MKVKVTKQRNSCWYNEFVGSEFDVTSFRGVYYTVGRKGIKDICVINKEDCEAVPEEQWLTKAEALKLCIDGAKITNKAVSGEHAHIYWNGKEFMFILGESGEEEVAIGVLDYSDWYLWTPPEPPKPKYVKGQFVLYEESYYRIIDTEYKHGSHRYFISPGTYRQTKADCTIADESELTEVPNDKR